LAPDHWGVAGAWTVQPDAVLLHEPGGRIAYRFTARDLYLVMAPPTRGTPLRFSVRIDGQPPDGDHGDDVDAAGPARSSSPRLYQLIRQRGPITEHTFEITELPVAEQRPSVPNDEQRCPSSADGSDGRVARPGCL
jgi:hypothetical protein